MSIYTPYFYIIQHKRTKMYYAGCRIGKLANPEELLKLDGYTTSSKIVNNLILTEGIESFCIRKIKIFSCGSDAFLI